MLDIVFREDEYRERTGNAALNLNVLRKMALHRLKKMRMEKKRVSAKRRMMYAALDSDFLYEVLFSEQTPMPWEVVFFLLFLPRCLKTKPSRKDGCLKTKNLAKTILVPMERGANEVRDENQTRDF
jgi:hypothetical protein